MDTPPVIIKFRVVANTDPTIKVNSDTLIVTYTVGNVSHLDYYGGGIIYGKGLGIVSQYGVRLRYLHITTEGEFQEGDATIVGEFLPDGRLRLVQNWEWIDGTSSGQLIMEQI